MSILTLSEGTLFNNRYRIVRCIAQGGMGAVYEAIHNETERRRALKVMLPHLVQSEDLRSRFRQEAKVAAHIDSEFIVDVFDAGIDEETQMPFLVMELLRGEELGKRLLRMGRFSPSEVVTYLHQTALALDKTHRANIVHRDLKPDNLFLTEREEGPPRIKVLDFGVAKFVSDSATNAGATRSVGTPLYMAPEQFRPGHHVSASTDIFALGMMAYTLLVGVSYWQDESESNGNIFTFAAMAINGPQEPATARAARRGVTLPSSFDAWFKRAAAMDPADRYPTATEAILELADALSVPRLGMSSSGVHAMGSTGLSQSGAGLPSVPGMQTGAGAISAQTALIPSAQTGTGTGLASIQPVSMTQSKPLASQRGAGMAVAGGVVFTLLSLGAAAFFVIPRLSGSTAANAQAAAVPVGNEAILPKPVDEVVLPNPTPLPAEPRPEAKSPIEEKKTEKPTRSEPIVEPAPAKEPSAPVVTEPSVKATKAPPKKASTPSVKAPPATRENPLYDRVD